MKNAPLLLLFLIIAAWTIELTPGCTKATPKSNATVTRRVLRGVILEINRAESTVLIKHEDIPGFMPPMTMVFKVDADTLKTVTKGQAITATLNQTGEDYWLEDVKLP